MDLLELRKEQTRLAPRIVLRDSVHTVKTVGGAACALCEDGLLACVVVCDFPSFQIREKKTFLLPDPLPAVQGYTSYREVPALIEAFNQLEEEPDVLLVSGDGINHPRRFGIAAHLGLALQKATIGITEKLSFGKVDQGKIMANGEMLGFEVLTREYAKPLYISPGNFVSFGFILDFIRRCIKYPHKLPEPLHIVQKIVKKKAKEMRKRAPGEI